MKTRSLLTFAIGLGTLIYFGCKKDNPEPKPSMVGFWQGKYGVGDDYPSNGYAFLFRADGTIRVFNGTDTTSAAVSKAEGIYSILGSTVTARYTYMSDGEDTFSFAGKVNAQFTFLEGTWGTGDNTVGNGKYFVVKQ